MYLVKILRFFFVGGFILMLGMSIWITEDGKEDWLASQPVNYEKIEGVVESYWESHETVGLTSTPSAYFYLNNGNIYFCQNVAFLKTKNYKKQQAIVSIWVKKNSNKTRKEIFQLDIEGERIMSFEQSLLKKSINKGYANCLIIAGIILLIIGGWSARKYPINV